MIKNQYKESQNILSMQEVNQLINATKTIRDKVIIESAYFPALRRFEIAKLRDDDIDFEKGRIHVIGKGDKYSPIPVGKIYPNYIVDLKHYLESINWRKGYLFSDDGKKPLDVSRINQIFHQTAKIARLSHPSKSKRKYYNRITKEILQTDKKINPHLLRHSQARHLKDMKFSAEYIQNYLRHESWQTTMDEYGTLSIDEMERISEEKRLLLK